MRTSKSLNNRSFKDERLNKYEYKEIKKSVKKADRQRKNSRYIKMMREPVDY